MSPPQIHIEGMELGYKRPVLFERHAVGGEYGAGFKTVGSGKVVTLFLPKDGEAATIVDQRDLPDENNAVVTYVPAGRCDASLRQAVPRCHASRAH